MARKTAERYATNRELVLYGLAICVVLIALCGWVYHRRSQRAEWPYVQVPISEFRTVLTGVTESTRGSATVFQAEVHVHYHVEGRPYDRWLPILLPSTRQEILQMELSNLTKQPCYIHWNPARPDDAFLTCLQ